MTLLYVVFSMVLAVFFLLLSMPCHLLLLLDQEVLRVRNAYTAALTWRIRVVSITAHWIAAPFIGSFLLV